MWIMLQFFLNNSFTKIERKRISLEYIYLRAKLQAEWFIEPKP